MDWLWVLQGVWVLVLAATAVMMVVFAGLEKISMKVDLFWTTHFISSLQVPWALAAYTFLELCVAMLPMIWWDWHTSWLKRHRSPFRVWSALVTGPVWALVLLALLGTQTFVEYLEWIGLVLAVRGLYVVAETWNGQQLEWALASSHQHVDPRRYSITLPFLIYALGLISVGAVALFYVLTGLWQIPAETQAATWIWLVCLVGEWWLSSSFHVPCCDYHYQHIHQRERAIAIYHQTEIYHVVWAMVWKSAIIWLAFAAML